MHRGRCTEKSRTPSAHAAEASDCAGSKEDRVRILHIAYYGCRCILNRAEHAARQIRFPSGGGAKTYRLSVASYGGSSNAVLYSTAPFFKRGVTRRWSSSVEFDVLIAGSGLAGLSAALSLAES